MPAASEKRSVLKAKKKILIIEDESDVAEMLKRQLDRAGAYSTITAADGTSGITQAREQLPSLLHKTKRCHPGHHQRAVQSFRSNSGQSSQLLVGKRLLI